MSTASLPALTSASSQAPGLPDVVLQVCCFLLVSLHVKSIMLMNVTITLQYKYYPGTSS